MRSASFQRVVATRMHWGRYIALMRWATLLFCLLLAGCFSGGRENPSFPLTWKRGEAELQEMAASPRSLSRPVVVVGGYMDRHAPDVQALIVETTGDGRVIAVTLGAPDSLEECRAAIIGAVEKAYPCQDGLWTAEVDVVGVSLGGLAARYSAVPGEDGGKRLRIARLFTVASPHCGAVLAKNYIGDGSWLWRDLRPGSKALETLAASDVASGYEMYPYARLHDRIVGVANTAPPGQTPIWMPAKAFQDGHSDIWRDPRVLADICRRLRGETPYATEPRAALPD